MNGPESAFDQALAQAEAGIGAEAMAVEDQADALWVRAKTAYFEGWPYFVPFVVLAAIIGHFV